MRRVKVTLAAEAVAMERWRWLPGMRDSTGCRVVDIIDPWLLLASGDAGVGNWTLPLRTIEWCNANMLPDLDDATTLGAIERWRWLPGMR